MPVRGRHKHDALALEVVLGGAEDLARVGVPEEEVRPGGGDEAVFFGEHRQGGGGLAGFGAGLPHGRPRGGVPAGEGAVAAATDERLVVGRQAQEATPGT